MDPGCFLLPSTDECACFACGCSLACVRACVIAGGHCGAAIRIQPDPSSEEQRLHNLRCAIEEIYGAERTYLRDITFLFEVRVGSHDATLSHAGSLFLTMAPSAFSHTTSARWSVIAICIAATIFTDRVDR